MHKRAKKLDLIFFVLGGKSLSKIPKLCKLKKFWKTFEHIFWGSVEAVCPTGTERRRDCRIACVCDPKILI